VTDLAGCSDINRIPLDHHSATSLGSPSRLQHTISYTVKSVWHPAVHLVGTGDVNLVILVLYGQINFATTLDLFLPTSGDRLFCEAMVEWRNS